MADCRLMLNFNGANGDTDVIDDTGRHISITFNGTAQISTTNPKFGTGCLLLDGDSDYLSIPASADWNVLADDSDTWTVEFWVKHDDHVDTEYYIGQYQDSYNYWNVRHLHGSGLRFVGKVNSVEIVGCANAGEITDTLWHHIMFCKVNGAFGLYKDRQQIGWDAAADAEYIFAAPLTIGRFATADYFDGRMDHMAIWKGNPYGAAPNSGKTDTIDVYRPGGQFPLDDDAASTTIRDSSGNGNNATLNGGKDTEDMATFLPVGGALKFDGAADYGLAALNSAFNWGSGDGTVFAWIRIASTAKPVSSVDVVVSNGDWSNNVYYLGIDVSGGVRFGIDDGSTPKLINGNTDVCDNEPHLIAGVRNGNQIEVYLDGVSDKTPVDCTGVGSLDDGTYGITLGALRNGAGVGNHIAAVLAQVVTLPGQALTAAQLLQIYTDGMNGLETPRAWQGYELLPVFPTLARSPSAGSWTEQPDASGVRSSGYRSGYPLVDVNCTFTPEHFRHGIECLSDADKATLRTFYENNKGRVFLWLNVQDSLKYQVIFEPKRPPTFGLAGRADLWNVTMDLVQVSSQTVS